MHLSLIPSFFITLIFMTAKHPLAMTLLIIIQTLIICLSISTASQTFWFSYILFLVFLGGMLVLFIYITSLASNEILPSMTIISTTMLFFMISFFIIIQFLDVSMLNNLSINPDMLPFINKSTLMFNEPSYLLTKLYNNPTNFLTLMLVSYLFLTLIAVVKITNIFLGPLRQKY
uniref:NADH-ubiquinone oxidoreductase chain 6 n=1 Tax=Mecopoda niponensis TaxID=469652 RepID=M9NM90_MECNI|nr:NADH dehydrogenase subunit 6 [Mecopoda niponensis]AFK15641.1 NADH dehydrogenase subunit 6 [Mecopoda niponensis]